MTKFTNIVAAVIVAVGLVFASANLSNKEASTGLVTINPASFESSVSYKKPVVDIAQTSISATTTLLASQSGSLLNISASGTTIILPAVGYEGTHFTFAIGGSVDTGNVIVASAEGDNIEGTLIVAGAVVDCDGEDFINFVTDGENVGDYVEVYSNGSKWFIGDSGVLTAAKMTCTDPS